MQSLSERLERLRENRRWTWAQLASSLDLSVSMLMMVRRGERELSQRAMLRLSDREVDAGLAPPPIPKAWQSSLRERLQAEGNLDKLPSLSVITGEDSIEALEEAAAENFAQMRMASAQDKPIYLKLAAFYLANLHERLKDQSESVPKGRALVESVPPEEAPAGPVRIPPQVVSVAETLPNVHPGARDRVRDGALRAMRLARGGGSSGTGKAVGTTGSTSSPSKGSPSAPHP